MISHVLELGIGAGHIAPHCYYNVYGRKFVQQFAILRLRHVNTIELFYQPNCVLVDLRHSLRASGVTFKYIGGQILSKRLGDLAPAGIVDADKRHLGFLTHTSSPDLLNEGFYLIFV